MNPDHHGDRPTTTGTEKNSDMARLVTKQITMYPSANITCKCFLLFFLSDTKEFGNTVTGVYHQKQRLHVIVKLTHGDELGSLCDAAWRSLTC